MEGDKILQVAFYFSQNFKNSISDSELLNGCLYDKRTDPDCPVFRLKDLLVNADVGNIQEMMMQVKYNKAIARHIGETEYVWTKVHFKRLKLAEMDLTYSSSSIAVQIQKII